MDKKYVAPVSHAPITVNVDDWLKDSQPKDIVTVQAMAQEQIASWHSQKERAARESLLADATECSECGKVERPYHNDYMCYMCRDVLDS